MHVLHFFVLRSVQDRVSVRAQCAGWAVKQMTFSLRRPLTPSSACRGLVTEGMGKGHTHVDFFTACPHVKACKRPPLWKRHKDLWFSLTRSLLAPQQSGCRVQHQSRCGGGNMTLAAVTLRMEEVREGGGWGGIQHYITPLVAGEMLTKRWKLQLYS